MNDNDKIPGPRIDNRVYRNTVYSNIYGPALGGATPICYIIVKMSVQLLSSLLSRESQLELFLQESFSGKDGTGDHFKRDLFVFNMIMNELLSIKHKEDDSLFQVHYAIYFQLKQIEMNYPNIREHNIFLLYQKISILDTTTELTTSMKDHSLLTELMYFTERYFRSIETSLIMGNNTLPTFVKIAYFQFKSAIVKVS